MAIPIIGALGAGQIALSAMATAIQALYGVAGAFNDYLDKHIEEMKGSENHTISQSGRVLGGAKKGFGIGYITPVVIIAVGQLLLGNPLSVAKTVITTVTLTNPIAMTCAAIGAIFYGWGALSDAERNELLEKLSNGLEIGVELIKSIVRFVIDTTKELLSSKSIHEIKDFIGSAAKVFGKTLGDVTGKLVDKVSDTVVIIKEGTGEVVERTIDVARKKFGKTSLNPQKLDQQAKDHPPD